jgi:imidazolonepropionase
MQTCDKLLLNATTIDHVGGVHEKQAIAIDGKVIAWCGSEEELPPEFRKIAQSVEDCQHKLITPALIDCHTHLVYAGNRADEFQKKLKGATYADIARKGGGILSTVQHTRSASEEQLLEQSLPRILALKREGVLTVEIKSGYGLDLENELKMLRVAKKLGKITGIDVITTFLGAHTLPPEFSGKSQAYVDYLCNEVLPQVVEEGLADCIDVFCESIGFSLAETEQLFLKAKGSGLAIKCHAEQLSNLGGSSLAANLGALSCDHLEHLDESGVTAMAKNNTVAVLLPGAYYFLCETRKPPINLLRDAGVGMAIATDCNPGSSPTTSLLLMMSMACHFFLLTVPEVLSAVTYQAARALGVSERKGKIAPGMEADLLRWAVQDPAELCYYFGYPIQHDTMLGGEWITV